MHNANYTSENICFAMGMDGFANDWHLAKADESIRLLLMPSFHPEVCVSFTMLEDVVYVRVDTPREHIWRQDWPTPHKTLTDVATGTTRASEYTRLLELFERADNPPSGPRFFVLDGMQAHCIHRKGPEWIFDIEKSASAEASFMTFIGAAISLAWGTIDDPRVRNALRCAGTYLPKLWRDFGCEYAIRDENESLQP